MSWSQEMSDIFTARETIKKRLDDLFDAYNAQGMAGGSSHQLAKDNMIEEVMERYNVDRYWSKNGWVYYRR